MKAIKKYFFYRRFRYYRKNVMTLQFIKHRLFARKLLRQITVRDKEIEILRERIKQYDELIKIMTERHEIMTTMEKQPYDEFDLKVGGTEWKVGYKSLWLNLKI